MLFFPIAIAWTFCPVLNESDKNESVCLTPNNIGKTFNTAVLSAVLLERFFFLRYLYQIEKFCRVLSLTHLSNDFSVTK